MNSKYTTMLLAAALLLTMSINASARGNTTRKRTNRLSSSSFAALTQRFNKASEQDCEGDCDNTAECSGGECEPNDNCNGTCTPDQSCTAEDCQNDNCTPGECADECENDCTPGSADCDAECNNNCDDNCDPDSIDCDNDCEPAEELPVFLRIRSRFSSRR